MTDSTTQPTGKPKRWSDDEKALLALLLLIDFEDARRLWLRYAGVYGGLINAVAFANKQALAGSPSFWFDIEQQRYAIGRRGYIPADAITRLVDNIRRRAEEDAAILGAQVSAGIIPVDQFQTAMVALLKPLEVAVAALGRGGLSRVDDDDKQAITEKFLVQLTALDLFARQIVQHDRRAQTPEAIIRRARFYADDAVTVYHDRKAASHEAAGFIEELNVLGVAEHCGPDPRRPNVPDCPSLTKLGWVAIGTIAPIGERVCLWNCRCQVQYRRAAAIQRGAA